MFILSMSLISKAFAPDSIFGRDSMERLTEFKPGSVGVGIGGMRQRVSELGGKLKLENTNPGTLVQVVIPNTSAEKGEQLVVCPVYSFTDQPLSFFPWAGWIRV
jgi:hypothetical protein